VNDDPITIKQAYRFAVCLTPEQENTALRLTGASRFWFNQGLALVKERLGQRAAGDESVRVPWSYMALQSEIKAKQRRELAPWQADLSCGTYMTGFEALGAALQNFSRARKKSSGPKVGFPRFKAKGRCRESVYSQGARLLDRRHLHFPGVGALRSQENMKKLDRLLQRDRLAKIQRGTLGRHGDQWWISFTVKRSPKQRRVARPTMAVGVDLGIKSLATLSTGEHVANTRPLQQILRKLRLAQRSVDRQRRASNPANYLADGRVKPGARNWNSSARMLHTEQRIRGLHVKVSNRRREQAHQLTTALTREYGIIGAETLNTKNMMSNKRLARHIADVGWATILYQLQYKTAWTVGSLLVQADRYYPSSKTCSTCGSVKPKLSLSERVFECEACGLVLDRDLNAALNLLCMAIEHALAEGIEVDVAGTYAETLNARGATDPEAASAAGRATALNRKDSGRLRPARVNQRKLAVAA
jgi:putative transposase